MSFKLNTLVRDNIRELIPYSSARNEFSGKASVFLDANESPFNAPYNRYPDPLQTELKKKVSSLYQIPLHNIFLGNGSDEAIDLIYRIFCRPGIDNVISIAPSYGMYEVSAGINDVEFRKVLLNKDFSFSSASILQSADSFSKLVFLCSPNNPTGNLLSTEEIRNLLNRFTGIAVVDEAYIDFAKSDGMLPFLEEFPNLIVLRTFSKAWGLPGIRLGMAFASEEIIQLFNKVKYPYNLNILTQKFALENLKNTRQKDKWVNEIIEQRRIMEKELSEIHKVKKIFPSDANFLLVRMKQARELYLYLIDKEIIVRDRSGVILCEDSLRITLGSREENQALMKEIKHFDSIR